MIKLSNESLQKDLTNFLNCAGAKITWKGRTCFILGVNSLNEIPDMNDIYPGIMGNTQGDKKLTNPDLVKVFSLFFSSEFSYSFSIYYQLSIPFINFLLIPFFLVCVGFLLSFRFNI